ncbi:hypothetical protein B0H67DRAFT_337005 [Lasiosphaeris hirsuta]|uniref:Zn(2)-C6 fungal-type domain-containing protein n=1 Tax=Lasiosphaeris hirsuta TaxID=260670 RepID=A0AA40A2Y3_9PEZI|nr:hypothetical protein B0H67DRAFT_337005 [Lasiosphaeris hirsuta]
MSQNVGDTMPDTEPSLERAAALQPGGSGGKRARRTRLALSCGECRSKKLSCDRNLPCQRCIRSGRPEKCSFGAGARPQPTPQNPVPAQRQDHTQDHMHHDDSRVQVLQAEIAQLKALLSSASSRSGPTSVAGGTPDSARTLLPDEASPTTEATDLPKPKANGSMCPSRRQHILFQFFDEMPQLLPFVKETADECFKPRGVSLKKIKHITSASELDAASLESLLPPRDIADSLVSFYLDHFEHLHRLVHVPTFKREYAGFWSDRKPSMSALILSMMSIAASASANPSDPAGVASAYRSMPAKWIYTCDKWIAQQSTKGHGLIYYQVSCLIYLAKRMNSIKTKRFWNETGSLIQSAIMGMLHFDPPSTDSPYNREMKRRIWTVLRELELQNSFEYGLPTLLHNLEPSTAAPSNIDDDDFDQSSKSLPPPQPASQYTGASYQSLSARSWSLRLEISRRLFSTGVHKVLSIDHVLRYTHELTQLLDSLTSWTTEGTASSKSGKSVSLLASAFLQFQLKTCILAIHRPYLNRGNARFNSLSEVICYHTSRDVLLLNRKLAEMEIQSLTLIREDFMLAALTLTRISMQPKGTMSVVMANIESTVDLLEQCLPLAENRYLACLYGKPQCLLTIGAAIMLLKIHLGKESLPIARSSFGQRFLGLYYRHFARQQVPPPTEQTPTPSGPFVDLGIDSLDSFDFDMDWGSVWGSSWAPVEETFGVYHGVVAEGDALSLGLAWRPI